MWKSDVTQTNRKQREREDCKLKYPVSATGKKTYNS